MAIRLAPRRPRFPRHWLSRWLLVFGLGVLALAALPALAADPCSGFIWDVGQERALFATSPQSAVAGSNLAAAATLLPEHLFRLSLLPEPQVSFVSAPGKSIPADGAFAGLAVFQVAAPGTYRIATDEPFWIDVVLDGQLIASKDYQGAPGCRAPRKIVEFDLPAAKHLVLQLSGASSASTLVTITRTPAPKS